MEAHRKILNGLRIAAVLIVITVLVNPLSTNGDPQALAQGAPPRSDLAMSEIAKKLSARGYTLIGSGSWTSKGFEGKSFRDPLNPGAAIQSASDFDMTLSVPKGTPPNVAVARWREARQALIELVNEHYTNVVKNPAAANTIIEKINLYPPDQLIAGVQSNAEALERFKTYGAVPKLSFSDPLTGPDLDAEDLVGGVYGEGAEASRRWKELTQGIVFENGNRVSVQGHMIEQGMRDVTFTVKGTASMARQWSEFASYWIEKGDPVTAEKYISRMANDLKAASGLAGAETTNVANRLKELANTLKAAKGPAALEALAGMRGELTTLVSKAEYQAAILERLTGSSARQANLLWTLLDAADHTDSKLSQVLGEFMEKAGGAVKALDILVRLKLSYEAIQAAGNGDYDQMLADVMGIQGLNLPLAILGPLVQSILDDAKTFGYDLVASRQSCDELLAGHFTTGGVEKPYTIEKLVDEIQTEEGLRGFVEARSRQAADRGFEGTASDKITKGSADAIYEKCYPYVLGGWQKVRQQLYTEYRERWNEYAARGLSLEAQPEPAYLDPTTNKVTVQVTAASLAQQKDKEKGYAEEKALQALGARLAGKPSSMVRSEFTSWSLAPDGGPPNPSQGTQSFTFSAPGTYELKVASKLTIWNNGVQTPGMNLDLDAVGEGAITIHVLKAENKPLCGGGPVIKSATRATLEHEVVPVTPGQVATPGVYVTGAGDFSATDPTTGAPPRWQTAGSGMRYCTGCPCLPPKEIGSFEIAASGRIKAVLDSPQHVPWLHTGSRNASLQVAWEPKIGQAYGRSQELLSLTSAITDDAAPYHRETEVDVPGPGRISAWIGAPMAAGPTVISCIDQPYTAQVEVLSVGKSVPVNGETKLGLGDHIRTDGGGEAIIVMPWGGLRKVMPNSDLSIERVPSTDPDADCQEWTLKLNNGRLRIWSASIEEAEGGGIQAGSYTVKP